MAGKNDEGERMLTTMKDINDGYGLQLTWREKPNVPPRSVR